MSLKNKIVLFFVFAVLLTFVPISSSEASPNAAGFDDRIGYDIYFNQSQDVASVIKDVGIEGFKEIGSKTFLVIKPGSFKLSDTDGFILFDSVVAILPSGNFRVMPDQRINILK